MRPWEYPFPKIFLPVVIFIWVSYCNVIANGDFSNNIMFPYVEMAFYNEYHLTLYTLILYFTNIFLLSWNGNRPTKHYKTNRGKSPQNLLLQRPVQNQEIDFAVIELDGLQTWLELHTFTFLIPLWFSPSLWYYNLLSLQFFLLLTLS